MEIKRIINSYMENNKGNVEKNENGNAKQSEKWARWKEIYERAAENAVKKGKINALRFLLERKKLNADELKEKGTGWRLTEVAIWFGKEEALLLLLEHGASSEGLSKFREEISYGVCCF
jgi:hypothetical protein